MDFAILVKNLPDERLYGDNKNNWDRRDDILKALLSKHFEHVIKQQILIQKKKCLDFSNIGESEQKIWEVADICFGKTDMDEIVQFQEVASIQRQMYKLQLKISKTEDVLEKERLVEKKVALGTEQKEKM